MKGESMTNNEIRRLYHRADYDKPKLLQVLADLAEIATDELKIIIKDGDEKMAKWDNTQTEKYKQLTAEGKSAEEIAVALGVSKQAVYDQRNREKKKTNISLFTKDEIKHDSEINKKIAELCETPTPKKEKADYSESLIETLREEIESKSESPAANDPDIQIHDIYHKALSALNRLKDVADQSDILLDYITLSINRTVTDVSGGNSQGECAGWHKKYYPKEI